MVLDLVLAPDWEPVFIICRSKHPYEAWLYKVTERTQPYYIKSLKLKSNKKEQTDLEKSSFDGKRMCLVSGSMQASLAICARIASHAIVND